LDALRWCSEEAPEHDEDCHDHNYNYGGDSDSFRTHRFVIESLVQVVGYAVLRRLFVSGGIPYQQKHENGNEQMAARRVPN
jgi:hypothetical protein